MTDTLAIQHYISPFIIAFVAAVIISYIIRRLALRWHIIDRPQQAPERKIHPHPVALLGGLAVFISFVLVVLGYTFFSDRVLGGYLLPKHLIGIVLAGLLIMIGGFLDDKYNLSPSKQIIWPIAACLVVIASGIGIAYITNPFGGMLALDIIQIKLFSWGGAPYYLTLLADLFALFWLMGMMYTTKFLDGLDGLVSGISTIGAFILFFLSLDQEVAQPETALLAIVWAGVMAGFLILNFYPAKIFLGEGGSLFAGFMLGVLSIISGAKIATALLIMGVPILDVLWVIIRRVFFEKKSPFRTADKKHLHFRLLDMGLTHRQAVLILYVISLTFGGLALVGGGRDKLVLLCILVGVMMLLALSTVLFHRYARR